MSSNPRQAFTNLLGAVTLAVCAAAAGGCENNAIGRPCDVQSDAAALQAVVNGQALECPTRICLKPSRDNTVGKPVDTAPYCTAECSKDSDCSDGQTRDMNNGKDKRCTSGFVCGVATVTGSFCCRKVCLCKDFIDVKATGSVETPSACMKGGTSSCVNL